MFKSLQEQIATKVNQTNQILRATILSHDSTSSSNQENNLARLDVAANGINYIPPVRQALPPSDIESEPNDGDDNDRLLKTYRNKFNQLKHAYDEVERDKENIKDILQKSQDSFLQQKEELRQKLTSEQKMNVQLKKEIKARDQQIEELAKDQKELQIQREKRVALMQERDFLLQLNEKQTAARDSNLEAELRLAKQQITELHQTLTTQNEQHAKSFDALKTEYENLTNELYQTKQARDDILSTLHQTDELLKAALQKLQRDQEESPQTFDENTYQERVSALKDEIHRLQKLLASKDIEIETLRNTNEENTRRMDRFEEEIAENDRQITERDERIEDIQSTLEQSKESNEKLRKALQKLPDDYEQRLKEQEAEYNLKLKAMAKEMSTQIDDKERLYQQQLNEFIQDNQKTEKESVNNSEEKLINAEQRAVVVEEQLSRLEEQLKEKQLDHYRVVQDLQNQIRTLTKQNPLTAEFSSQTINEESEVTEMDYLKEIFRGYMSGTDPLTMVKVICAVLRCTDEETSSIIEHERLRQSRWLNSSK